MFLRHLQGEVRARAERMAAACCLAGAAAARLVSSALLLSQSRIAPDFVQGVVNGVEVGLLVLAVMLLARSMRGREHGAGRR